MANRSIVISLPAGREDALIEEAAGYLGWSPGNGSGTAARWIRKEVAGMLRDVIRTGRERTRRELPHEEDNEDGIT